MRMHAAQLRYRNIPACMHALNSHPNRIVQPIYAHLNIYIYYYSNHACMHGCYSEHYYYMHLNTVTVFSILFQLAPTLMAVVPMVLLA